MDTSGRNFGRGKEARRHGRPRDFGRLGPVLALAVGVAVALSAPLVTAQEPVRIMLFGDSLVAGYGLPAEDAIPAKLEAALADRGIPATVLNAGVSGDTTAGGVSRLAWALADDPDFVVVELGANDGLRGIDPANTRDNLDRILSDLAAAEVPALLAGMMAPRNLGPDYAAEFDALYPDLAAKHGIPLYPFFLEGVALQPDLNQPDGIHPNAAGVDAIVDRFTPILIEALDAAGLIPA